MAAPMPPPPPPPPVVPVERADEARTIGGAVTDALEATMARAATFSGEEQRRSVDGEWCVIDSFRHVILVVDLWLSKTIHGEADPFDPMALPPSFMPPKLPGTSIDPEARPTFDEACAVLRDRLQRVRAAIAEVSDDELGRPVANHAKTVGGAWSVLFGELRAHDRFVNRDLDVIETSRP
jgi:hypothetical protein